MYDIIELNGKSLEELYTIATALNISKVKSLTKEDLIYKILAIFDIELDNGIA